MAGGFQGGKSGSAGIVSERPFRRLHPPLEARPALGCTESGRTASARLCSAPAGTGSQRTAKLQRFYPFFLISPEVSPAAVTLCEPGFFCWLPSGVALHSRLQGLRPFSQTDWQRTLCLHSQPATGTGLAAPAQLPLCSAGSVTP